MVNLTIGGGNFKGISYLGALEYLHQNNLVNKIDNFYGTSVGSIIGTFFLIGYTPFDIFKFILELNLEDFWDFNITNIETNYSLISDALFIKFKDLFSIKENADITFSEFYKKTNINLNIFATSLTKRKNVCFNAETYPDLKIITAVQASSCIPLIFPPVVINDEYFVDGCMKCIDGICSRYIYNDNNIVHFIIKGDYNTKKINSFLDYLSEVISCTLQNEELLETENTIKIYVPIEYNNKYNFNDIKKSDKLKLFNVGLIQTKEKFKNKIDNLLEIINNEINNKIYNETKKENNNKTITLKNIEDKFDK